ncbi:MAG: hypothetical protein GX620_11645 [Chloroflexi bacterium]|nr:hypothetical protein [Chloroflexota bacterium]
MGEHVVVRQNYQFETEILAADPHTPESDQLESVAHVFQLTPYGMLLAGLGACTAVVLNTYAEYHGVGLEQVELRLTYDRVFDDDCETCLEVEQYRESISEEIVLIGDLSPDERRKLLAISKQCPIHKMLRDGIPVKSLLAGEGVEPKDE